MTKLKTLKDIEIEGEEYPEEDDMMSREQIKKEAIKWVKVNEKAIPDKISKPILISVDFEIINSWIKYFFNITEKDLKDA